ncbi:hypothetical protein N431DRAFT_539897 [Stipitochalara longipes BDJ]|nr:hypothetical protein N431DRAFT_539897 [Stipitochalara longipes BDJ]
MSTARRLVSRGRQHEELSPVPRSRQRRQDAEVLNEPTPLPPYEPPSCPLSASAQKMIDDIRVKHDHEKYRKHLKSAIDVVTNAAADNNERLAVHKDTVQRWAEQRKNNNIPDDEKPEHHIEREKYTNGMEKQVSELTTRAEKALRDLIDYGDELVMQDSIMKEVSENLAAASVGRPAARRTQRDSRSHDDEEGPQDENAPAANENILSAVELLKEAKDEHVRKYTSKSMRERYADHNEYKNFKRSVHDALHPGENQPPVPHASTWFPDDNPRESAGARRRRNNTTDNTNNFDEDDDDEIEMIGTSTNLKCPLSLQIFKEPYSNNVCSHTFEKSFFEGYFEDTATTFTAAGQPRNRGQPQGTRQTTCPQSGCDKMLRLEDFYIDQLILRKVQRMEKQNAQAAEDDDDEGDSRPRGTQRNRPTQIDDDEDDDTITEQEQRRRTITKIKREREKSRGVSVARAASLDGEEVDAMETD